LCGHEAYFTRYYDARNAPNYKFNNLARDVSAVDEHLSVFLDKFILRMRRSAISELPVKTVGFDDRYFLRGTGIFV